MLIIGEIFSLLAAVFLAYSTFAKKKQKMVFWQILDSSLNAISNIFLLSYSGCITNIFTVLRNYLTYKNKLNKRYTIIFIILMVILGCLFNNKGIIGLFQIIASIEYTLFMYRSKTANNLRTGLIINLTLWGIYDFYIKSYPMLIMDIVIIIFSITNNIRRGNFDVKNKR